MPVTISESPDADRFRGNWADMVQSYLVFITLKI